MKKIKKYNFTTYLLILITSFTLIYKSLVGMNEDEEWFFAFIKQFVKNPRTTLLTRSWDIWQISGTINSLFAKIILFFSNSDNFLMLSFRILTIIIITICAVIFYNFLIKEFNVNKKIAIFLSCIFALSVPKGTYNLENSCGLMIFYFLFNIELFKYIKHNNVYYILLSALFLSISVIYYPTIGAAYIFAIVFLIYKKINKRDLTLFSIIPIILFILFFIYFISENGLNVNELIYSIKMTVLNNESHNVSLLLKIGKDIIRCVIFSFTLASPIFIYKKIFKIKNHDNDIYWFVIIAIIAIISSVSLKIGGSINTCTFVYLVFLLYFYKKNPECKQVLLFYFILLLICFISTDQNLDYNCRYLLPSVLLICGIRHKNNCVGENKVMILMLSMIMLCNIFFLVAVLPGDFGNSSVIFSAETEKLELSPYKEIIVEKNKADYYNNLPIINFDGDNLLIISKIVKVGAYSMYDCNPLTVNMSGIYYEYGDRWCDYFDFINVDNTYIMIDKSYFSTINDFASSDSFGKYLLTNFSVEKVDEFDNFVLYELNR